MLNELTGRACNGQEEVAIWDLMSMMVESLAGFFEKKDEVLCFFVVYLKLGTVRFGEKNGGRPYLLDTPSQYQGLRLY